MANTQQLINESILNIANGLKLENSIKSYREKLYLTYQGIIDRTLIPQIQKQINRKTPSVKITDIDYDNGNSIIKYQISPPTPLSKAIAKLTTDFDREINTANLEKIRVKYLGRKGKINLLTQKISTLPLNKRAAAGRNINQLKSRILSKLQKQTQSQTSTKAWLDVTAPGQLPPQGHLHPITLAIKEITTIFKNIGFNRVRYPEVDWDWYVFQSLNMPPNHPARDEWETFFINTPPHRQKGSMVLTTHTSNGQVREMERVGKPPIRMLNIAKCYRRQHDITHTSVFHQFEGLVIDKGINISHLKGTLDYFAKKFYGPKVKSRIRPFMFKFTEPSFEVDFSCVHCAGRGCKFCKSGWHEVGGSGMVHPNVLRNGGINPNQYTGFAFGWGVERVYTLKPGLHLNDIRPLYGNNLDFLEQF